MGFPLVSLGARNVARKEQAIAKAQGQSVILQGVGARGIPDAQRRSRFVLALTFCLVVALPSALAAIYYGLIASDQYVSEIHFGVRSGESKGSDALGLLAGLSGGGGHYSDTQVVVDYLKSAAIVSDLDGQLNLRHLYADKGDFLARFEHNGTLERLTEYWRDMVRARHDGASQTVVVAVRAFTAEDSMTIAGAILARAERLVNDISNTARQETLKSAAAEVKRSEERLLAARAGVRAFRSESKVLDPSRSVLGSLEVQNKLALELNQLKLSYESMRQQRLAESAPTVVDLKARIGAAQGELDRVKAQQTASADPAALPAVIEGFENRQTETMFAEKSYVMSLAMLERARADADRNTKFLAVHVMPTMPESAILPARIASTLAVAAVAFLAWGIGWLAFVSAREHFH